jgi:nucleoid-associated protein YejK
MFSEHLLELIDKFEIVARIRISKIVSEKGRYVKMLIGLGGMQISCVHMSLNYIEDEIVQAFQFLI